MPDNQAPEAKCLEEMPEWPSKEDRDGRLAALQEVANHAASLLGIDAPRVQLSDDLGDTVRGSASGNDIEINQNLLDQDEDSMEDWIHTVFHEVHHVYGNEMVEFYDDRVQAHLDELLNEGIDLDRALRDLAWGSDELEALRNTAEPDSDDEAFQAAWDRHFDFQWRISHGPWNDLAPGPGLLTDNPTPPEERAVYDALALEEQAEQFAADAMSEINLPCNEPGDVEEDDGRS